MSFQVRALSLAAHGIDGSWEADVLGVADIVPGQISVAKGKQAYIEVQDNEWNTNQ